MGGELRLDAIGVERYGGGALQFTAGGEDGAPPFGEPRGLW